MKAVRRKRKKVNYCHKIKYFQSLKKIIFISKKTSPNVFSIIKKYKDIPVISNDFSTKQLVLEKTKNPFNI